MASVTWDPGIKSSNPTITMTVNQTSQNIANNTSTVSWSLVLKRPYNVNSTANKPYSVVIDGETVASGNTTIGGSGNKTIASGTRTINHASDGTKSLSFSFSVEVMPLYWSGTPTGNASGSGSMTLTTIPRASSFTYFNTNKSLEYNVSNKILLTLSRHSTAFKHDITLLHGNTVITSWTNQDVPSELTLSATHVNTLLSRMPNVTSTVLTLRVQTKHNGNNVGGVLTRTANSTINPNVRPTASGIYTLIHGTGRDKTINKYIQNVTKVTSGFTGSAGYGATITSSSIEIKRKNDSGNSQIISGTSGTTTYPVSLSGTYVAIATVRDSRGRTNTTHQIEFTVHAYQVPTLQHFNAARVDGNPTTVKLSRKGVWYTLGGDNPLDILIQRRPLGGAWSNVHVDVGTSGNLLSDVIIGGNSDTSSYEFRLIITDTFNNSSRAVTTVSTGRVGLSIGKDIGIGAGKVWEQGALDVGGDAFIDGILINNGFIVESGSTPNGKYIKYGNGTMVCTAYLNFSNIGINNAHGSLYRSNYLTWTFPKKFVGDRPYASAKNNITSEPCWDVGHTLYHDRYQFYLYSAVSHAARDRWLALEAVGRWK